MEHFLQFVANFLFVATIGLLFLLTLFSAQGALRIVRYFQRKAAAHQICKRLARLRRTSTSGD